MGGLEPPPKYMDMNLNHARMPIPPHLQKEKRETGIEPATPTLARWCSTAEPLALTLFFGAFGNIQQGRINVNTFFEKSLRLQKPSSSSTRMTLMRSGTNCMACTEYLEQMRPRDPQPAVMFSAQPWSTERQCPFSAQ